MKKMYLAVAAAMMFAGSASAQFKLGVEGGINLNNLLNHYQGETVSNQIKVGIHAGVVADYAISNNFSVVPGLRYIMKGGKEERNFNQDINGFPGSVEQEHKLTFHYIELPLNLVYKTGTEGSSRFLIGAGPYFAYMVNGQDKFKQKRTWLEGGSTESDETTGQHQIEIGEEGGLKATDVGFQGFLGYQWATGPYAKIGSSVGLSNIVQGGNSDFYNKNYNFFLTLGYMFGR